MSNKYIVKVDISGKQEYIYSSNRLKEIIGASEIIRFVTEDLGKMILKYKMGLSDEVFGGEKGNVLYNKGGNSAFIFEDKGQAKEFNKIFSRIVMKNFAGLQLLLAIQDTDIENCPIWSSYQLLEQKLTKKKESRRSIIQRVSFGMTKKCPNTGKPVGYQISSNKNEKDEIPELVSKESFDKRRFFDMIYGGDIQNINKDEYTSFKKQDLIEMQMPKEELDNDIKKGLRIVLDGINKSGIYYDDISGQDGEKDYIYHHEHEKIGGRENTGSYIGISCLDGNKMGVKIDSFKKYFESACYKINNKPEEIEKLQNEGVEVQTDIKELNIQYITDFDKITKAIDDAYKNAYFKTLEYITANIKEDEFRNNIGMHGNYMPIRHIVLAGDDVTFISNGKISIEASKYFVERVAEEKIFIEDYKDKKEKDKEDKGKDKEYKEIEGIRNPMNLEQIVKPIKTPLTVSGGIGIVSTKYPFSRAVKLVSKSEKEAKSKAENEAQILRYKLKEAIEGIGSENRSDIEKDIISKYNRKYLENAPEKAKSLENVMDDIVNSYDIGKIHWEIVRGEAGSDKKEEDEMTLKPYSIMSLNKNEAKDKLEAFEGFLGNESKLELIKSVSVHRMDLLLELYKKLFVDSDGEKIKGKVVNFFRKSKISKSEIKLFIHKYGLEKRLSQIRVKNPDGTEDMEYIDIMEKKEMLCDLIEIMNMHEPMTVDVEEE